MVGAVNSVESLTILVTEHPDNFSYVTSLIEVLPLCEVQALPCVLLLNAMYCCQLMDLTDRTLFMSTLFDKIITPVWL